jgi:hypothetical protein
MIGDWRKLRNEELHNLYYSPDTISYNQLYKNEIRRAYNTHQGEDCILGYGRKMKTTRYQGESNGRALKQFLKGGTLKQFLEKWAEVVWTGFIWLRTPQIMQTAEGRAGYQMN